MPLVFDSVFTAALARELDARWSGRRLEGVRFDRETRRVHLGIGDDSWVWLLHPREGVLVPLRVASVQKSRAGRGGRRKHADRGILPGPRRIASVESPVDTRRLILRLDAPESADERLVFDLVTNRWNAVYVVEGRVRSVLLSGSKRRPITPGDEWAPGASGRRWAETSPAAAEWAAALDELRDPDAGPARRRIAWLSGINDAAVMGGAPGGTSDGDILTRYLELRDAAVEDKPAGWLLPAGGARDAEEPDTRPYVSSLGLPGARHVGSVLDALAAYADRSPRIVAALGAAAEDPETARLREALEGRRERTRKKMLALQAEISGHRDPEELRNLGHLLLARKTAVPAGVEQVRLEDFTGDSVTIALDPTLDAVGNAEAYYDDAKRLERAAARLPARLDKAQRRLAALEDGLVQLEADGPSKQLWRLAGKPARSGRAGPGGGKTSRGTDADADRLPYRTYRTSSGLEIRAGRSAKANDELTFHHSAPDDIWMHVREAPGSHVVLRWGRKDQNPPEADIAEAALVAAVLSRARGSGIVPVAWTRRKYVRKPRKAGPGMVVTERTRTVFVEPDLARANRLAEAEE